MPLNEYLRRIVANRDSISYMTHRYRIGVIGFAMVVTSVVWWYVDIKPPAVSSDITSQRASLVEENRQPQFGEERNSIVEPSSKEFEVPIDTDAEITTSTRERIIMTPSIVDEANNVTDVREEEVSDTTPATQKTSEATALFGNGCFWCVESDLEKVAGVKVVVSGYAGGTTPNPTYKNYAEGGHREVVEVTYDPTVISYEQLVEHILKHGDPTDAAGSFGDRGVEYAPALYYVTDDEKEAAERVIKAVDAAAVLLKKITIAVLPSVPFWPAEEYHQDYAKKNPIRYTYYRVASGRSAFIEKYWGERSTTFEFATTIENKMSTTNAPWETYVRPSDATLRERLTPLAYKVIVESGTERAGTSPYDKLAEPGIYVDVLSGEPLFLSRDKYDSGTGWPSFVKPVTDTAVTLHEDRGLFQVRTEVRSRIADAHLGHVFTDGPKDRGGLRYCMNGVALRFVPKERMQEEGYGAWYDQV